MTTRSYFGKISGYDFVIYIIQYNTVLYKNSAKKLIAEKNKYDNVM